MQEIKFLKEHIERFEKMRVQTVYLFGSQAQGNAGPLSDFDIGVVLSEPKKYKDKTKDLYSKLYDIFTEVLPREYLKRRFEMREHEFDLVFLQYVSISLQFEAIKGKVLYEKDKEARLNYEEYIVKRYCDLEHVRNVRKEAILNR